MAIVTGNLTDFGVGEIRALHPQIIFTPSGPATGTDNFDIVLASRPIYVDPDDFGTFSVELVPNEAVQPDTFYTITLVWLNGAGVPVGKDYFTWELRVPAEGGPIGGMILNPTNPALTWIGPTPPPNPTPGTWWLNSTTGDLAEWSD